MLPHLQKFVEPATNFYAWFVTSVNQENQFQSIPSFMSLSNIRLFLGTCTIIHGSYKLFTTVFGISAPYVAVIFSYIMILRKYKISRNKIMEHSASLRSRISLSERRMSKVETSFYEKGEITALK